MQLRLPVAVLVLGTALSACGSDAQVLDGEGESSNGEGRLDCRGASVSTTQIESGPLASGLPESAQKAFSALTGVEDIGSYRVLEDGDGYLTIGASLSKAEAAELGPGPGPINFRMTSIQSSNSGGESAYGWWYVSDTACELQRTFQGLSAPDVWLDPAFPAPKRGDTAIHLLVSARDCAGGEQAGDRIKVAELVRDATQVRLAIGIKPQSGAATCPGIPPEPFSIDLESPLGDEEVLNSAAYPARPFAPPEQR